MNTLLVSPFKGIICITLLFGVCFLLVHTARLVQFGQRYRKQQNAPSEPPKPQPTPPPEKKAPPSTGEPVYYIVERKRRTKSTFSEPKRIDFK